MYCKQENACALLRAQGDLAPAAIPPSAQLPPGSRATTRASPSGSTASPSPGSSSFLGGMRRYAMKGARHTGHSSSLAKQLWHTHTAHAHTQVSSPQQCTRQVPTLIQSKRGAPRSKRMVWSMHADRQTLRLGKTAGKWRFTTWAGQAGREAWVMLSHTRGAAGGARVCLILRGRLAMEGGLLRCLHGSSAVSLGSERQITHSSCVLSSASPNRPLVM